MSSNSHSTSNTPHTALAELRTLLEQPANWPKKADELLARLRPASQPDFISDPENETLLSLVVDDALRGVDISIRYPAFFQHLLADAALRHAFLETLEDLESQAAPLPIDPHPALGFLSAPALQPILEFVSPARWRLSWQAALDQIQAIFFAAAQFEPIYRSADDLEDNWFTLLRNEVDIDQAHASVVLEAVRLMTAPDQLQLHIAVGVTPDRFAIPDRLPDLRAQLIWGAYDQAVIITQRGRATFPPLPLNLVLDATSQRITADLRLTLEPAL